MATKKKVTKKKVAKKKVASKSAESTFFKTVGDYAVGTMVEVSKILVSAGISASDFVSLYGKEGISLVTDLGAKAFNTIQEMSLVGYNVTKELGKAGVEQVKNYTEEYADKYEKLPKPLKVALMTAVTGGAVVASPFLIAALSEASIIAILAALGGGAIAVGGLGVAGGVAILILSCATTSTLTALISSKIIKDPEVEKLLIALRDLHAVVEKNKVLAVKHMKKIKEYDEKVKDLLRAKIQESNKISNLRGKLEEFTEQLQGN